MSWTNDTIPNQWQSAEESSAEASQLTSTHVNMLDVAGKRFVCCVLLITNDALIFVGGAVPFHMYAELVHAVTRETANGTCGVHMWHMVAHMLLTVPDKMRQSRR